MLKLTGQALCLSEGATVREEEVLLTEASFAKVARPWVVATIVI